MFELLGALENDPEIAKSQRRRMQILVLAFVFAAVILFGHRLSAFSQSSELCTGADTKLAEIWNNEKKSKIQQSFAQTGLSYAPDTSVRVAKRFNDYLGNGKTSIPRPAKQRAYVATNQKRLWT